MSNELIVSQQSIDALDQAAHEGMLAQNEESQFSRMFKTAQAIDKLKNLLTPKVMEPIMNLQNNSIGFKTDNKAGYPLPVVKNCLIEATLKGVFPVGNEFNIIAGNCYITKEGFGHKLRDVPNFSWIETPGIPRSVGETGAIIKVKLEWTLNGKSKEKELELAIRVNKMMGTDAIIGKAIRKARAWLFTAVTGQEVGDGESDADVINVKAEAVSPFEAVPADNADLLNMENSDEAANASELDEIPM